MNQSDNPTSQPKHDLKQRLEKASTRTRSHRFYAIFGSLILLTLGAAYFVAGSGLQVNILPEEAQTEFVIDVRTGVGFVFDDRVIALPGDVEISVASPGFKKGILRTEIVSGGNVIDVVLERLPDILNITVAPNLLDVVIQVDGVKVAEGFQIEYELEEGNYVVSIGHPLFQPFETELTIQGGGNEIELDVTLSPATQPIEIRTEPEGAQVSIDGDFVGISPFSTDVLQGRREIKVSLAGFVEETRLVNTSLGEIPRLPTIQLSRNPGMLSIGSVPVGASVLVDNQFRGTTPITFGVTPNQAHAILLSHPGYEAVTRNVSLEAGTRETLTFDMSEVRGLVEITSAPAADVFVGGTPIGVTPIEIELRAVEQEITITKQGYQPFTQDIAPDPLIRKSITVNLITNMDALIASAPKVLRSSNDQAFVLIGPGEIKMGAPRSEPGQRANEVIRKVNITRYFYVSAKEVTANQYAKFQRTDGLGKNIELSDKPVTNVTWSDAARYANWVSNNDGLRPVYFMSGNTFEGFDIDANGYRLPTEAEWVWISRYEAGQARKTLIFPWGHSMPIPPDSGNFADESSVDETESFIPKYRDGMPRLAPVGAYASNQIGILDLGGNVSEWIHDFYELGSPGPVRSELNRLGPSSGNQHVIRGSSWRSSTLTELRLSYREAGKEPRDDVGFRLVRWLGGRNGE